ncbi:MAG: hypothetical protein HQL76_00685 [Magnetococcales bacterium]|nr:hypothetical protein [Magnetococcales bacterium]
MKEKTGLQWVSHGVGMVARMAWKMACYLNPTRHVHDRQDGDEIKKQRSINVFTIIEQPGAPCVRPTKNNRQWQKGTPMGQSIKKKMSRRAWLGDMEPEYEGMLEWMLLAREVEKQPPEPRQPLYWALLPGTLATTPASRTGIACH